MASNISSYDHRVSTSRRRLKPPLLLRDYLVDDLSSCSSNGFKSFPRRQCCPSTVRLLLDAEIKRSRFHRKRRISRSRTTCGMALGYAVQKASAVFVNAVKLLPFASSVKPQSPRVGILSRSFTKRLMSRSLWKKSEEQRDRGEMGGWRSLAELLEERVDQPSDGISTVAVAAGENDGVEEVVGAHVNRSSRKECVNEEKEQFSPVSVLECPFQDEDEDEDDALTSLSHQQETKGRVGRRSRRFGGLVRLEPVDLEKRIERYTEKCRNQPSNQTQNKDDREEEEEEEEDESKRAKRLFGEVKSRMEEGKRIEVWSNGAENVVLDYFQEERKETEKRMVKRAEEWLLGRQEEMSWEVREKREFYVKDMMDWRDKWGCFFHDTESVVHDLVDQLLLDFISSSF